MSFNLLHSVQGLFSSDLIGKASSSLGESESGIQKAIGGIIPSVLAGMLNKAGSGEAGSLLNLAKDAAGSGILGNLGGLLGGGSLLNKGADLLKGVFGDKTGNVINTISGFAGIKESSTSSLLSMAAPAALGVLGKHASETNLGASGLLNFLSSQKDSILNALPSGLNLAGALGLSSLGSIGTKLSGALSGFTGKVTEYGGQAVQKTASSGRWFLPLILILAAIALLAYFWRGCSSEDKTATVVPPIIDSPVVGVLTIETLKVRLPDGVELEAYKGGIEDRLVTFLNTPSAEAGKDVWFDFDNLNFKTGSADLTDESTKQVQNIVAILKAYPALVIKIGGYTDKTGDSLSNIKLSQNRANAVQSSLKANGGNAAQISGAEGYGSQFAVVPADASDEARRKDRRIALGIRKK